MEFRKIILKSIRSPIKSDRGDIYYSIIIAYDDIFSLYFLRKYGIFKALRRFYIFISLKNGKSRNWHLYLVENLLSFSESREIFLLENGYFLDINTTNEKGKMMNEENKL